MQISAIKDLSEQSQIFPENEMDRLLQLAGFDLDYTEHENSFKNLAKLAAKVAGTSISLVNMIDSHTQWTLSNHGLELNQMSRQDSVCQHTIMSDESFEVNDLSKDERFKDKFYVNGNPNAKYYFGIPLNVGDGINIGALCVLDQEKKVLDPEKVELLKLIADEIVNRLKTIKVMEGLKMKYAAINQLQVKVVHDIRGPLGGIIGLASIIRDQGENNQMDEVLEYVDMIYKSGNSILDMADEILDSQKTRDSFENGTTIKPFNLLVFKEKLERLYLPQAINKNICFTVITNSETESISLSKSKLLQITGNLISNSIKFTPEGGEVIVDLGLVLKGLEKTLLIVVKDSGVGMTETSKQSVLKGTSCSTNGTEGEHGYGLGLALVKHLIESLTGTLDVYSEPDKGTIFTVRLPQ